MALTFGSPGADREELASWLRGRREVYAITGSQLAAGRQRLAAKGYLGSPAAAVMYRARLHAETEVRWHDEFAKILAELGPGELAPKSAGSQHAASTVQPARQLAIVLEYGRLAIVRHS